MNTNYEVFTQHKQGIPVLVTDCPVNAIFELGEPIQTNSGLNGFLTDVSSDGREGVLDVSPSNVYNGLVSLTNDADIGTKVFYDPATGALTDTVVGNAFGTVVRSGYNEIYPVSGGGIVELPVMVVNS